MTATGLATLRRDGFASLDAPDGGGELTTRPIRFAGDLLYVNAATGKGTLRAEILDVDDKPIAGFSLSECEPFSGDKVSAPIRWQDGRDLGSLANRELRIRFVLSAGSLYSFWVEQR